MNRSKPHIYFSRRFGWLYRRPFPFDFSSDAEKEIEKLIAFCIAMDRRTGARHHR